MAVEYTYDKVNKEYRPTLYPGEKSDKWEIPELISKEFNKLNSIIESKYSREFLKICAFYNKMFPSLKTNEFSMASYNVQPFTTLDQERSDTGTGTNYNYLKQIVDQITSRLGTVTFIPMLQSEEHSLEYVLYKSEVERILRTYIKDDDFNRTCLESFHNAAILGYSHAFINPYTGQLVKAPDYEVGIFESQFNHRNIKQMLYRDYAFPTVEAVTYITDLDDDSRKEFLEGITGSSTVDFKMYFDCVLHKVYTIINHKLVSTKTYDFDNVLMTTFQWDVGFARQLTTSEFDLLYPIQREINKIAAKIQQLVRMYKGSVPVFNADVDLAMKAISNGTGEALYIDSSRNVAELMTVINPTPLDPQLSAQIQEYKTAMYELAGIQNASFDMENMRSAAAVIALDQTRDSVFQAQMSGMSQFIKSALCLYIKFFTKEPQFAKSRFEIDWESFAKLIDTSYINLQPVHLNDPLSDENATDTPEDDYALIAVDKVTLDIIHGKTTYDTLPYFIDEDAVIINVVTLLIKFEALHVSIPDCLHIFLMNAFIAKVRSGELSIA